MSIEKAKVQVQESVRVSIQQYNAKWYIEYLKTRESYADDNKYEIKMQKERNRIIEEQRDQVNATTIPVKLQEFYEEWYVDYLKHRKNTDRDEVMDERMNEERTEILARIREEREQLIEHKLYDMQCRETYQQKHDKFMMKKDLETIEEYIRKTNKKMKFNKHYELYTATWFLEDYVNKYKGNVKIAKLKDHAIRDREITDFNINLVIQCSNLKDVDEVCESANFATPLYPRDNIVKFYYSCGGYIYLFVTESPIVAFARCTTVKQVDDWIHNIEWEAVKRMYKINPDYINGKGEREGEYEENKNKENKNNVTKMNDGSDADISDDEEN